jgi:hypothetical protein
LFQDRHVQISTIKADDETKMAMGVTPFLSRGNSGPDKNAIKFRAHVHTTSHLTEMPRPASFWSILTLYKQLAAMRALLTIDGATGYS